MTAPLPHPFTGVKLVVWDLDDTFWSGTLDEGGIRWEPRNERIVRALAAAGVVSSICSNNDHDRAAAVLREHGLWEHFVFPRIAWHDKARMIGELLGAAGLRADDVAFVDDNARVREAVRYRHPRMRVLACGALSALDPGAIPVLDPGLRRLERYRVLERKASARSRTAPGSDREFLEGSRIRVSLDEDPAPHRERIVELIARTNQLNFTKVRLAHGELDAVLGDRRLRTGTVRVTDRFGDYGIAGFYALDEGAHRLRHFLFSCRVLNMGVEQFVWRHLGRPALDVVSPVASDPATPDDVDWIAIVDAPGGAPQPCGAAAGTSLLMKGGCDLLAMQAYLHSEQLGPGGLRVDWELLEHDQGVQRYGHSALGILLAVDDGAHVDLIGRLPWLRNWQTRLFGGDYDWACLSLWVDYACTRYRHRATGLVVPAFEPLGPQTPQSVWRYWWGEDQEHRSWFESTFEPIGPLTPGELRDQLIELRRRIPRRTGLVVMNGAEVDRRFTYPWGAPAAQRHRMLNAALDAMGAADGMRVLDVRRRVHGPRQLVDMQTHFSRRASFDLAADLRRVIGLAEPADAPPSAMRRRSAADAPAGRGDPV